MTTFDFTGLGDFMPGDRRSVVQHKHYGEYEHHYLSTADNDARHHIRDRAATALEISLLRHHGHDAPESTRCRIRWSGPIRRMSFYTTDGRTWSNDA